MPREKMWVEWDDGGELSRSRKRPGKLSPLVRDHERNLNSQVVLEPLQDDDPLSEPADLQVPPSPFDDRSDDAERGDLDEIIDDTIEEIGEAIGEVVALLLIHAIESATPRIKQLWIDRGRPAIASAKASVRRKLSRDRKADDSEDPAVVVPREVAPRVPPGVEVAVRNGRPIITSEDALRLLVSALAARAISDQLLKVLSDVTIDDPDNELGPADVIGRLDPAHLDAEIERILALHPSLLDDVVLQVLGSQSGDGAPALHSAD